MQYSKLVPLLLAASFANPAFSAENPMSKFYVGGELGFAEHTVDASGGDVSYDTESGNSFAPSLIVGYKFNQNWSIIGQYISYGEADLFDADIDLPVEDSTVPVNVAFSTKTTGLGIAGQWMSDRAVGHWHGGAKLGLIKWSTDFNSKITNSALDISSTLKQSDSGVAIYGGFIGAYSISEALDLTLAADWFVNDLDVDLIDGTSTNMQYSRASIGFLYSW